MTATLPDRRGAGAAPAARRPARAPERRPRPGWDATAVLQLYLVALFAIPSIVVVQGLGSVGSPATLLGAGLLGWWAVSHLVPGASASGRQPIRVAVGLLLASVAASFVAAGLRGYDGLEQRAGDRGLLMIAGMIGVALVAADGIRSRRRLDDLLRVVVAVGAAMAVIGLLQFRFAFDVAAIYEQLPGLTFNGVDNFVFTVGVHRVASTAGHPIEFGMVLTLILPIALHRAFHAPPGRARGRWILAAIVAIGIPLSISRSAVVSLAVALVVLCAGWPSSRRWWVVKVAPLFLVGVRLLAPGTLGTLWSGLLGMEHDPSIQGRAERRALVVTYIVDRPVLGRGFATFLPDRYLLLDNQYLGILVELGVVGFAAVLGVFGVALVLAVRIRRRDVDPAARDLALALAASTAAAAAGLATFDGFGFAGFAGLVFLLFGCVGALDRLTRTEGAITPAGAASGADRS